MIRERIYQQMLRRGVNQGTLCNDLCLTISNFNAFIRGKRSIPYKDLIVVMKYLRLSVAPNGSENTNRPAELMNEIVRERIKEGCFTIQKVGEASGVHYSNITSFITGKRTMSSKPLGKLLHTLGLDIVPYKKAS